MSFDHDRHMNPPDHHHAGLVHPSRRRPWWWLLVLVVVVLAMLVVLTVVPPTTKHVYWFQAFIMGRTNDTYAMVIPPPRGYTGQWTTYHRNLTIDSEMDIVDGKLHGRWRRYHAETGLMWWSGGYVDDVAVGDWYWYDANGYLIEHKPGPGFHDQAMNQPFMLFWLSF